MNQGFTLTSSTTFFHLVEIFAIAGENVGTAQDSAFVHTTTDTCGGIIFSGSVSDSIVCQYEWIPDDTLWFKPMNGSYDTIQVFPFLRYADSLERTGDYRCEYYYYSELPDQIERIYIYRKELVSCSPFPTSNAASDILERDPDLESVKVWVAPSYGQITILSDIRQRQDSTASFLQSKTRDGMSYAIQHSKNVWATPDHMLSASNSANTDILATGQIAVDDTTLHHDSVSVTVLPGDLIFFRLVSGENHDYDNVEWDQTIRYVGSSLEYNAARDFVLSGDKDFGAGAPGSTNKIGMSVKISTENLGSSPNAVLFAQVVDTNDLPLPGSMWTCPLLNNWSDHVWNPIGSSTRLISQGHRVKFFVASTNTSFPWEKVRVTPHIDYYVWNNDHYDTVECYPQVRMLINNYDGSIRDSVYHRLFGPLYKGWGQFAYNNNDTVNGQVVHDSYIHLEKLVTDWNADYQDKKEARKARRRMHNFDMPDKDSTHVRESSTMVDLYDADTLYNPLSLKTSWVEMQPDFRHYAWVGYGNVNYITDSMMCNTRMPNYHADDNTSDIEDYDHPVPVVAQGLDVKTVRKQNYSKMKNHSLSLSAPGVPFSAGTSVSRGYNQVLTDYIDLNGDRYPDILGPSQVQYSQPWGGIGGVTTLSLMDNGVSLSETESGGMNFGGSFEMPSRGASNNPKNAKISFDGAGNAGVSHGGGSDVTTMTWMDMNGDGLPDKVVHEDGALQVYMNTGYRFLNKDTYSTPHVREGSSSNFGMSLGGSFNIGQASIGGGIGVNYSVNDTKDMLMDFNGDGLPDIVRDYGGYLGVSYNMGNGSWNTPEYVSGISGISLGRSFSESADASVTVGFTFAAIVKLCVGISGSPYSRTFSKDSIQLTDVNGDGYVDYVTSRNEGSMTVRYNQAAKTNLLRKVTNFTGSNFEMAYDMPLACYDKPQRGWNLAKVEVFNDDTLCSVGGNRTLTHFGYANPNHNRVERMDYGYGTVTTYQYDTEGGDTLYRYTVEEYENHNFAKRGRKTRDCVYDAAGRPYVEHLYDAIVHDLAGSEVTDGGCARADVYVGVESDLTNWYEGQSTAQVTSRVVRRYDRYRNVTEYIHYGDTTHHDEWFKAEIEYAQNMSHNLTALPVQIVVRGYGGNTLQRRTASYYPTGKLQQLTRHNFNNVNAQYDFIYDNFGNLSGATLPENASGQRLNMKYYYDTVVHTYPVRVENASLGYVSTAEYNLKFGKPTKTTDINGNQMRYQYDVMGRNTVILAPYELAVGRPYTIRMEYFPKNYGRLDIFGTNAEYSHACTYHYDCQHPDDPIKTTLLADGLGRLLQTKKDAEIHGQEVSLVTGRVQYDCFGRTTAQYHPFTEDTSLFAAYNPYYVPSTRTSTWYDVMDRQTMVELPTHDTTAMAYGFGAHGGKTLFSTITTDAMGNSVQVLKGTLGQQIKLVAPYNTVTLFDYDCLGQLLKSTDPDGFMTTYKYDMFGQLTRRTHPDAGVDWYEYDPAGNMVRHINGNGRETKYYYYYTLLAAVRHSDFPANDVHYTYGGPGAIDNAAGRILRQEDASGWQTFSYGPLGEVTRIIRTFALPNETQPYTLTMEFSYDSYNRIREIIYPDGEVVNYGYDRGGMLKNMQGDKNGNQYPYIDDILYNEFGLKEEVFYGNGTYAHYTYDILQRLSHLECLDGAGDLMQDIDYTYDVVGNITDIENYASVLPNGLGGPYSHHHDYDPLYRIEHSEGWWGHAPLPYTLDMKYHDNGRIQRKTLSANTLNLKGDTMLVDYDNLYHYVAGCSKLREVSSAVDTLRRQAFAWSGAGNLIEHQDESDCLRHLCWDEENRMQGFADCDRAGFYQYDAGGDRTYKLTGDYTVLNQSGQWHHFHALDNPTLYASPYMVCTPKGYTKHYYAESERVASRIGDGGIEPLCRMVRLTEMPEVEPEEPGDSVIFGGEMTFVIPEIPEEPEKPDDEQLQDPVPAPFALEWGMVDCNEEWETFEQKRNAAYRLLQDAMSCVGASFMATDDQLHLQEWEYEHEEEQEEGTKKESDCYWYHPDHLGSSSWITDTAGTAIQHLHYLPWGEDFVNQRTSNWSAMYTFSAKEKDAETGYSYFGARYYDSGLSIWLSVDPMSDKYPSMSPYTYCANNPVKLVDPNGEEITLETIYKKDANGNDTKEIERYNIRITGKILNCSGKKVDMEKAKDDIANQIESSFSGTTTSGIPVTTTVDLQIVNSIKDVDQSDHLIYLSNGATLEDGSAAQGNVKDFGKMKAWVDAALFKGPYDTWRKTGAKVAAHEMGHLLGLRHDGHLNNLMRSPRFGTNISSKQLSSIVKDLQYDQKVTDPRLHLLNKK